MRPIRVSRRGREAPPSPIRKLVPLADEARRRGVAVHGLNIGQPDLVTPPIVWEALDRDRPKVVAYAPSNGTPELRASLARYYHAAGIDYSADELMVTIGGSEAILMAMASVADAGDEILVPEPFYANYLGFARMLEVKIVPVPTSAADGYHLPPASVWEERISARTRAILFANPGNPTGAVYEAEEMELLVELASRWGLFLIADEVYREFCYDGRVHLSIANFESVRDRAIVVDSVSKRFSLCGARIGCLATKNADVLSASMRIGQARLSPPVLEQTLACAAFTLPQSYFDGIRAQYQLRRDVVMEELAEMPGVFCRTPHGAFYVLATLPIDSSETFASWMLSSFSHEGETTFVAPGGGFYATPGSGAAEVRIAYVFEEVALRRALRVLGAGLAAYPGRTAGAVLVARG